MTKTVRVYEVGGPEGMRIENIEAPPPARGQGLVRNHAIGVNFIDIYFRGGAYPVPSLPFTPGNEGAGEIIALGKGVTGFKLGDRVAYATNLGAYAGERLSEAERLVKVAQRSPFRPAGGGAVE